MILGGHSLGASLTAAYAAWDFNGKPGYKDVDGLVLIDGGLLGSFDAYDLAQAQQQIADLQTSNPFIDLLGIGLPRGRGAVRRGRRRLRPSRRRRRRRPRSRASRLLPDAFKPPFPVTNRALFGHAFDRDTSPEALGLLHVNAGALAATGDPRDWVDGGVTPIARLAETFGQEPTQRDRVVLPEAADDRHQRRQPDEDERRGRASSACG